ncbi:MAG: hypothetical protein EOO09_03940 [Chitinophagaceae bacterium]|nr:MAG: hypothetical protein EOO09_03940 [Chitinophagaceae bacterium]
MKQFTNYLVLFLLAVAVVTTVMRLFVLWFRPSVPKSLGWLAAPPSRQMLSLYYLLVITVCIHVIATRLGML